jgi:hypothetical protein
MAIDRAELKIVANAELGDLDSTVKRLNEVEKAIKGLGETKMKRDLQSQLTQLRADLAAINEVVSKTNLNKITTKTSVQELEALIAKAKQAKAELVSLQNSTARALPPGGATALRNAVSQIVSSGGVGTSRKQLSEMVLKSANVLIERTGMGAVAAINKVADVVAKDVGIRTGVETLLKKNNLSAANMKIVGAAERSLKATADAEAAFMKEMETRQRYLQKAIYDAMTRGRAARLQITAGNYEPQKLLEYKPPYTRVRPTPVESNQSAIAQTAYRSMMEQKSRQLLLTYNPEQMYAGLFDQLAAKEEKIAARQAKRAFGAAQRALYQERSALWKEFFNTQFGDFNQRYRPGMNRAQRMEYLASQQTMYTNLFDTHEQSQRRRAWAIAERQRREEEGQRLYGTLSGYQGFQNKVGSHLFTRLQQYGLKGENPFAAEKPETYAAKLSEFISNYIKIISRIPEDVRKATLADFARLNQLSMNSFMSNTGGLTPFKDAGTPVGYGLTGEQIRGFYSNPNKQGAAAKMNFVGQEADWYRYIREQQAMYANQKQPTYAPPKTSLVAWHNLKASVSGVGEAFSKLNSQVEQPLASIAIAFSRIAYGLRTVQFGLMAFGATFTGVIGGATKAAQGFAQSVLDMTEIQKKAEIMLRGTFGDEELASKISGFARKYAIETPATYREITHMVKSFGFIPQLKQQIIGAKDDAQLLNKTLEDMSYTAIALGLTKPEQGIEGAIFSMREALAGQFRSLKMRFEMPMSAVAATVGMTEAQLKEDPKKIMGALKNFMDINVGEDTIKRMYRTFSVQLQNIGDAFEKAKVRIGQSGFEQAMTQMAFTVATAFDNFLDIKHFEDRVGKISDLLTKFGGKFLDYGLNIAGALASPEDRGAYKGVSEDAAKAASKMVDAGDLRPQDVELYVKVQTLLAMSIDKLTVAYDVLLNVLDGVVPRLVETAKMFLYSKDAMNKFADNIVAFVNMLFDVAQGMIELMNGIVSGINAMDVGPKTKALMLFFLAFPVATVQTILATTVGLSKMFKVISVFATTGTLQVAGTALLELGTSIKQFVNTITAAQAVSGTWAFIKSGKFSAGGVSAADEALFAASVATTGGTVAAQKSGALGSAITYVTGVVTPIITKAASVAMGIMRGGLVAGIVLAVGALAETISGVDVGITKTLVWFGGVVGSVTKQLLSAVAHIIGGFLAAIRYTVAAIIEIGRSIGRWIGTSNKDRISSLDSRILRKESEINNQNNILTKLPPGASGYDIDNLKKNIEKDMAALNSMREERKGLIGTFDDTANLGIIDRTLLRVADWEGEISRTSARTADSFEGLADVLPTIAESSNSAAKSLQNSAKGFYDVAGALKGMKRSDLIGITNFFSSTNIEGILDEIDKFRLKDDYLKYQKAKVDQQTFMNAPQDLANEQFRMHLSENKFKYSGNSAMLGLETAQLVKLAQDFNMPAHVEKAKELLLFDQRKAGLDMYMAKLKEEADISRSLSKETTNLQIELAESEGRTVEAKIMKMNQEMAARKAAFAQSQLLARLNIEGELAKAQKTGDTEKIKELQAELEKVNNLLIEQKILFDKVSESTRNKFISEDIESVTKKFGITRDTMPEMFSGDALGAGKIKDVLEKNKEFTESVTKYRAQFLKSDKDARDEYKRAVLKGYDETQAALVEEYKKFYATQDLNFNSLKAYVSSNLLGDLQSGFKAIGDSVLAAVNSFAAQVSAALAGMKIVINVSAAINAALSLIDSTTSKIGIRVGEGLANVADKASSFLARKDVSAGLSQAGSFFKKMTTPTSGEIEATAKRKAKEDMEKYFGPRSSAEGFKPGGGGGGGKEKKDTLAERSRMLKEIADSEFVADALRKTAFHGYSEIDYKKKIEEIQKMKKDGVLKEAESTQYIAAIEAERHRKSLEFTRKMESERIKEITQFSSVIKEAEYNPMLSWGEANKLHEMKIKFAALELAESYKEIDFKILKATESIKLMNDEILKSVGMTKEEAAALVAKSGELEKQNMLLKIRKDNATGFEKGVLSLPSAKETFDKAKEAFVSTAASGLSEALAAAFNPDVESGGFRRAMSNLGKALRATVIKAFTDVIANNLVKGLFGGFMGQGEQKTDRVGRLASILGGGATTDEGQGNTLNSTIETLKGGLGSLSTSTAQTVSSTIGAMSAEQMATSAAYTLAAGLNQAASAAMAFAANVGGSSGGGLLGDLFGGSIGSMASSAGSITTSMTGFGGGYVTDSITSLAGKHGLSLFAEGGVVSKPTLAIIGEGGEPEGVAPFSKFKAMMNEGKKDKEEKPMQMNIVNVIDPDMVPAAIRNNPNTVVNVVAADINSRGQIYTLMRNKR